MKIILTLILTFFIQHSYALSNKDVQLYKTIFNDYRNGDFKKGDERFGVAPETRATKGPIRQIL